MNPSNPLPSGEPRWISFDYTQASRYHLPGVTNVYDVGLTGISKLPGRYWGFSDGHLNIHGIDFPVDLPCQVHCLVT